MDPKELALEHFEKVLVAAAGAWLIAVGAGWLSQPRELGMQQDLATKLDAITSYMGKGNPKQPETPPWLGKLERQLSPTAVPSASEFPAWVMQRRPQVLYKLKDRGPTHRAVHRPPVDLQLDAAERGKIGLTWQASVENEYVIVNEYEVQRKSGDAEWEKLSSVSGAETTYTDTSVASRASYSYRVISRAEIDRDSPVVRAEGMTLADDQREQTSSEAGPVSIARDVYIVPVTVTQVTDKDLIANPNATESAYLKVFKWIPDENKFEGQTYTVKVGETIGDKKKKRSKEYDFTTGATLVDVEIRSRKHPTLGYDEQVQVIKYKFENGDTEEANDKDKPEELKDVR